MHGARNLAYAKIDTEINVIIDSDDWLADNATEKIITFWNDNKSENEKAENRRVEFSLEYHIYDIEETDILRADYKNLLKEQPKIKLIASGGISAFEELPKLASMGCHGTIIGKAIYENRISLKELERFILN